MNFPNNLSQLNANCTLIFNSNYFCDTGLRRHLRFKNLARRSVSYYQLQCRTGMQQLFTAKGDSFTLLLESTSLSSNTEALVSRGIPL